MSRMVAECGLGLVSEAAWLNLKELRKVVTAVV
jgi:hypothetical protein